MTDPNERPDFTAGLGILARLCRPALRPMLGSTALAVVSTVLELAPFVAYFLAIRDLLDGTATASRFFLLAAVVAGASVARFVAWSKALEISHLAAFDVMADLRLDVARTIARLPLGWFTRQRSGKVQRDDEVEAAARAARIHDRILELRDGYDTELGEDGAGLSGGERQRIAIARAICKRSPVVLLDEATSALDPTSERLLREALANLTAERTVIVVAHRLETIRHADTILFVDGGRVVEQGTHDELVTAGGRYAAFWTTRERAAGWTLAPSGARVGDDIPHR